MPVKRQWGTEKNATPLSNIHLLPSSQKIALSRLAIVFTIIFWLMYVTSVIMRQLIESDSSYQFTMEVIGYSIVVTFLTFSALMYLIARQGAFIRFSKHLRVPRAVIDKYFQTHQPTITVLVPSYSEEPQVIRKTLLSAALQEYPNLRIVLLVDDNPKPSDIESANRLKATRALKKEINSLLSKPHKRFAKALAAFKKSHARTSKASPKAIKELVSQYQWAAEWLSTFADKHPQEDHVDKFFSDQVLRQLSTDLDLVSQALISSHQEKAILSKERVQQLYQRLVWIFGSTVDIFERKQFASLSHEPNKAMNLNAYIGLMGGHYHLESTPKGNILVPTTKSKRPSLSVPDSDFILTLDADSVLLSDYCLRLVHFLEQPDNSDVAVTQTPYSSFRGAPTRIERLSGATTDIQHILHQGMSHYNATFWVGANAVIRKKALEDIVRTQWVGGFKVNRYIQDNTVIEDTESSLDLALKGWRLVNFPERLSYSATPPDFGSLVVQRRRWANGGLLILPKLWAQIKHSSDKVKPTSLVEILLRLNYMASIAWSNFGLVFLLAYPYDGRLLSPLVLLAATPYFMAMASDLKYSRYHYSDIFRIYGFNLILLPVNLAGVFKSIQQALTAKKIPFARTPKVKNRTSASIPFVVSPLLIIGFSLFTLWRNIDSQNWGNAAFAGFNAITASWAVIYYIGLKNLLVDIWLGIVSFIYVDYNPRPSKQTSSIKPVLDWKAVLYHGNQQAQIPPNSIRELIPSPKNNFRRQALS